MSKKSKSKKSSVSYVRKCLRIWLVISMILAIFVMKYTMKTKVTQYPQPSKGFFVNDYCEALSNDTEKYIQNQAEELYDKTKAQIVVAMVPETQTESLEKYSLTLANKWGIGDKKENNGILILFTTEKPHVRMEVGKGLEGCLNDSKAGRILDEWAVDAKDAGRWNEAAINTWVETAKVVYAEYGLTPPKNLKTVKSISEKKQTGTMADVTFPKVMIKENKLPLWEQYLVSFIAVWILGLFPFAIICRFINLPVNAGSSGATSSNYYKKDEYSGGRSSGGSNYSGGGGSFGGGGASR